MTNYKAIPIRPNTSWYNSHYVIKCYASQGCQILYFTQFLVGIYIL